MAWQALSVPASDTVPIASGGEDEHCGSHGSRHAEDYGYDPADAARHSSGMITAGDCESESRKDSGKHV